MQLDFIQNQHEMRAFSFAVGVVVLTVLALLALILNGGGILFYIIAAITIILGFYMAWHIANAPEQPGKQTSVSRKRPRRQ